MAFHFVIGKAQEHRLTSTDLERFPESLLPALISDTTVGNAESSSQPIRLDLPESLAPVAPVAFGLYRGRSLPQSLTALDATTSVTLEQLDSLVAFFQLPQDIVTKQLREVRTAPPSEVPLAANTLLLRLLCDLEALEAADEIKKQAHEVWHAQRSGLCFQRVFFLVDVSDTAGPIVARVWPASSKDFAILSGSADSTSAALSMKCDRSLNSEPFQGESKVEVTPKACPFFCDALRKHLQHVGLAMSWIHEPRWCIQALGSPYPANSYRPILSISWA